MIDETKSSERLAKPESQIHGHYWNHFMILGSALSDAKRGMEMGSVGKAVYGFIEFFKQTARETINYLEDEYTSLQAENLNDSDRQKLSQLHSLTDKANKQLNDLRKEASKYNVAKIKMPNRTYESLAYDIPDSERQEFLDMLSALKSTTQEIVDTIYEDHQSYFDGFTEF